MKKWTVIGPPHESNNCRLVDYWNSHWVHPYLGGGWSLQTHICHTQYNKQSYTLQPGLTWTEKWPHGESLTAIHQPMKSSRRMDLTQEMMEGPISPKEALWDQHRADMRWEDWFHATYCRCLIRSSSLMAEKPLSWGTQELGWPVYILLSLVTVIFSFFWLAYYSMMYDIRLTCVFSAF